MSQSGSGRFGHFRQALEFDHGFYHLGFEIGRLGNFISIRVPASAR
jgi:hypothetical protein